MNFSINLKVIVHVRLSSILVNFIFNQYLHIWIISNLFFSAKNSGPFVNLSETIQRSAVELLFHLPSLDDSLLENIVCCCHGGQVGVSVIQYILQILHYRLIVYGLGLLTCTIRSI